MDPTSILEMTDMETVDAKIAQLTQLLYDNTFDSASRKKALSEIKYLQSRVKVVGKRDEPVVSRKSFELSDQMARMNGAQACSTLYRLHNRLIVAQHTVGNAWCTTYGEYISWRWPIEGPGTLSMITDMRDSIAQGSTLLATRWTLIYVGGDLRMRVMWDNGRDPYTATVEFSRIRDSKAQAASENIAKVMDIVNFIFDNAPQPQKDHEVVEWHGNPCWHALLPQTGTLRGYHIPSRPSRMKGLEIPFDLMVELAGIEAEVEEETGLVLVGYNTVLHPLYCSEDGECLQWHVECDDSPEHDQGPPFDRFDTSIIKFRAESMDDIRRYKRHFLGWCRYAVVTLGTRTQDYSQLRPTNAGVQKREYIRTSTSIGIGLTHAGAGINVAQSFERRTTERNPCEDRERNYITQMKRASKTQILLYCHSRQQAWLVLKTSVLLHMALAFIHDICRTPEYFFEILYASVGEVDAGKTASELLIRHGDLDLGLGHDEANCFLLGNLIADFWFCLNKLSRMSSKTHLKIYRYEFADVVFPPERFRLKKERQSFDVFGGWTKLLDRVSNVLFFEGIIDPIMPDLNYLNYSDWVPCRHWRKMPRGMNYLELHYEACRILHQRTSPKKGV